MGSIDKMRRARDKRAAQPDARCDKCGFSLWADGATLAGFKRLHADPGHEKGVAFLTPKDSPPTNFRLTVDEAERRVIQYGVTW
jgi:hypothetical protein